MFKAVYYVFFIHFNSAINQFGGFVIVKGKLTSAFCAVEITSHRRVMTQYIINKRTDGIKNCHQLVKLKISQPTVINSTIQEPIN